MKEIPFVPEEEFRDCPLNYTLESIGGKWKIELIYLLYRYEMLQYGQLKRKISGVSHKVLSNQLKELFRDDLISRTEIATNPPQVEYRLTKRGRSVLPILKEMYHWGQENHI